MAGDKALRLGEQRDEILTVTCACAKQSRRSDGSNPPSRIFMAVEFIGNLDVNGPPVTIRVTGIHAERMKAVLQSNAKPNKKLREAIKRAREKLK